jgi:hypothetical protein
MPLAWARATAFALLLAWIVGGPFYRQVLGGKSRYVRAWLMFEWTGLNVEDARFYRQASNGKRIELDPWATLGEERPENPTKRRLKKKRGVLLMAGKLCRALGNHADVRVVARRATRAGWTVDFDGKKNVCFEAGKLRVEPKKNSTPESEPEEEND